MPSTITVLDKRFELYMSSGEIQQIVRRMAGEITHDYRGRQPLLCPVLTGAYQFVADLSRNIGIPHELSFVRYASYSGMQSSGCIKSELPFSSKCTGRHVIIVEDVVDTGISMDYMLQQLQALQPSSIAVCSLFFKPDKFQRDYPIAYIGKSIPNDFIVGYGLDYNGQGRHYNQVYVYKGETETL